MSSSPRPALPPIPPPDDSEERAAQREAARRKEVVAAKIGGRGRNVVAGRRIALAKQQDKAAGIEGASNDLGLLALG